MATKFLNDQLSLAAAQTMAAILGFQSNTLDNGACGFRINLRDIPALPDGFTVGDALNAYLDHVRAQLAAKE